jgi:2-methylisocitrate lyase-like PEP mutase family enzyme
MSLRDVLKKEPIVIAPCAYDVVTAQIVANAGFPVCWITGLGHEASDLGCPDVGLTNAVELIRKASNTAHVVDVPIICDADTGFGGISNLVRTVKMFEAAGVSAIHIEDQTFPKRCGVLAGKHVIAADAFAKKIEAAVAARRSAEFLIIARTDAKALGVGEVIRRLNLYVDQGADVAMLGDLYTFDEYQRIAEAVKGPLAACAADEDHFSIQPNFSVDEWKKAGVKMVAYWHLLLFTAMKAVQRAVRALKTTGTTESVSSDTMRYAEYADIVKLATWLSLDEKYGDGSSEGSA